jgi:hypothetical protein
LPLFSSERGAADYTMTSPSLAKENNNGSLVGPEDIKQFKEMA